MFDLTNIKKIREKSNKSQEDIAEILNVSRSSYAMWESGNEIFPIKRLIDFSNLFQVSVDYIFGFNNELTYKNSSDYKKELSQERLKELRKENKLTQEKLADILNTNKSVICGYEKGRYIIATPFLYTICKKYNISADYLLGKVDNPKYFK